MNNAIPTTGQNLGGLMRMPFDVHAHLTVRFDAFEYARRLPVPDDNATVGVARDHIGHVGREVEAASVTSDQVTTEYFLVLPAKVCTWLHYLDLIVHGLER